MRHVFAFLLHYGPFFLFGVVFVEQVGLPIPAMPFLLVAGALVGMGRLNLAAAIVLPAIGALLADVLWFYLGRTRGKKVLRLLCRLSLRPNSCVTRTDKTFSRHGVRLVLVSKFIPGLNAVVAPMVGSTGVSWVRYLLFDSLGCFLYSGTYVLLGFLFSHQLQKVAAFIEGLGWGAGALIFVLVAGYFVFRYWQKRQGRAE